MVGLANVLPPPLDLDMPTSRLINNPIYHTYQTRIAALSLFPCVCIKYLPPAWGIATPSTSLPDATEENSGDKEQREWKRRIKMYCMCI